MQDRKAAPAEAKAVESSDKVSDKLVVITGASSGIGAACVIPFVLAGHPVLMLARNVKNMEKNKEEIVKKIGKDKCDDGKNIFIRKCDVTATEASKDGKTHSIGSAIKDVIPKDSKMYVDCLINNAGVMLLNSVAGQSDKDAKLMIDVNVHGVLNGIRAVTKSMSERERGTIINISSMAGVRVMSGAGVYCATKFAVHAITEALRQELAGKSVKVCLMNPGAVLTNLLSTNPKEVQDQMAGFLETMKPHGVLLPSDIADGCYFMYNTPPRCCIRQMDVCPVNQVNP